jgi:hypothetical protein
MQSPIFGCISAAILSLVGGAAWGQTAPQAQTINKGTITLLTGFGSQGYNEPGQLIEVSPGAFVGIAIGDNATAFKLTSQGAVSVLYTFPTNAGPIQPLVQAVNGRIYGSQTVPLSNFSLSLGGVEETYQSLVTYPPWLSFQLPDGGLYGTTWAGSGHDALVQLMMDGHAKIVHNFTAEEGMPYGRPIRASDGNFYGISAAPAPHSHSSTSAMVYRVNPQGDLSIMATYPDGRPGYPIGYGKEYLVQATNGVLYGTAAFGGKNKGGAIFQLSLDGTYKLLYEFPNYIAGIPTFLTEASDGNLYGVAQAQYQLGGPSSLFRITLGGQFETLQVLNGLQIGTCPCWLTQGSDGLFYGTTMSGGPGIGTAWTWNLGLPKPLPTVSGLIPASGKPGASLILWGENLLGATGVSFNGTPATTISNISKEYVAVTVPAGATTGPVTITTPNGSATSSGSFTVE